MRAPVPILNWTTLGHFVCPSPQAQQSCALSRHNFSTSVAEESTPGFQSPCASGVFTRGGLQSAWYQRAEVKDNGHELSQVDVLGSVGFLLRRNVCGELVDTCSWIELGRECSALPGCYFSIGVAQKCSKLYSLVELRSSPANGGNFFCSKRPQCSVQLRPHPANNVDPIISYRVYIVHAEFPVLVVYPGSLTASSDLGSLHR